jgi:hypothetical protein
MQLGGVIGIANGAMRAETDRFAGSAQRVAQETSRDASIDRVSLGASQPAAISGYGRAGAAASSGGDSAGFGEVDLAEEQITQLSSLRAFQANVAVLRTADEMLGTLVTQKG